MAAGAATGDRKSADDAARGGAGGVVCARGSVAVVTTRSEKSAASERHCGGRASAAVRLRAGFVDRRRAGITARVALCRTGFAERVERIRARAVSRRDESTAARRLGRGTDLTDAGVAHGRGLVGTRVPEVVAGRPRLQNRERSGDDAVAAVHHHAGGRRRLAAVLYSTAGSARTIAWRRRRRWDQRPAADRSRR